MSDLQPLLEFLEKDSHFRELVERAGRLKGGQSFSVSATTPLRPYLAAGLFEKFKRPMLVITAQAEKAWEFWKDLENFLPSFKAFLLPDLEILPFERLSSNRELVGKRMEIFHLLRRGDPSVIVASVRTLLRKLPPPEALLKPLTLREGREIAFDSLLEYLVQAGYERTPLVGGRGEFSVRGGILDIFPPNSFHPVRAEFFGDRVDSLREFALSSQSSISSLHETAIFPCQEVNLEERAVNRACSLLKKGPLTPEIEQDIQQLEKKNYFNGVEFYFPLFYPTLSPFSDYLSPQTLVILDEPKDIEDTAHKFFSQCEDFLRERVHAKSTYFSVDSYYLNPKEVFSFAYPRVDFFALKPLFSAQGVEFPSSLLHPFLGKLERLRSFLESDTVFADKKFTTFIALREGAVERVGEVLKEWGFELLFPVRGDINRGKINLVKGDLNQGFIFPGAKLCLITEGDIFGKKRKLRLERQTKEVFSWLQISDLKPGDFVVHKNHGIAKYGGMVQKRLDGYLRDYLLLEYAESDRLYIPLDQIKKVFKHHGSGPEAPKLSRLGSGTWSRTKRRVKRALRDFAFDLSALYAHRRKARGFSFASDTPWQRELEEAFPFEETPDQARTVTEVKKDMESIKPMDRLVCGDVGYGKTEVAIRAAFKAVLDGKQAMVLVPTTILAQQHYATFAQRFAPFPVFVEVLSRFKPPAEQREIIRKFEKGEVDVVIGTHRLLQKDIFPKDLGLVIIDEEQRFGVTHKEHLKEFKKTVDVLTLSATPIPRTLEMSLSSLRDLSLIDTPPEDRYPIFTYVGEYQAGLAQQAIRRELDREGQVYYVHNRVETIEKVAQKVKKLVPEAKVALAHGQMREKDLERIMVDFLNQKYNLLVCTTIIESGIDIPSVNTIIVEEAENLGLAQLYQLRGRVGRSNHRAYAYFFFSPEKLLTSTASERLKTISEFTELGSGLKVALRDLEIRGAGNLLGPEQHGHLAAVGFELYCELLEETVREIEGRPRPSEIAVKIDLPVEAHLPQSYIGEEFLRIEAYREIASINSDQEGEEVLKKLEDRYGPAPQPAKAIVEVAKIRTIARDLGLTNLRWQKGLLILEGISLSPKSLSSLKGKYPHSIYKPSSITCLFPKISPGEIFSFLDTLFGDIMLLTKRLTVGTKAVN